MRYYFITSLADLLGCVGVVIFFTFACWVSLDHTYVLEHINLYCLCSGTSTSRKIIVIRHLINKNYFRTLAGHGLGLSLCYFISDFVSFLITLLFENTLFIQQGVLYFIKFGLDLTRTL